MTIRLFNQKNDYITKLSTIVTLIMNLKYYYVCNEYVHY